MGCDDYVSPRRLSASELYPSGDELTDALMDYLSTAFRHRREAPVVARAIRKYVDARLVPIEARLNLLEAFNRPIGGAYG